MDLSFREFNSGLVAGIAGSRHPKDTFESHPSFFFGCDFFWVAFCGNMSSASIPLNSCVLGTSEGDLIGKWSLCGCS